RDHEVHAGSLRDRPRCHAARPEDRNLVRVDRDRLAEIGSAEVGDSTTHAMLDVNMETLVPSSTFRGGIPASTSACSKVKLQPSRNQTRSSRHTSRTLPRLSARSP